MKIEIFTDASYCCESQLAACGYLVRIEGVNTKHTVYNVEDVKATLEAELLAIMFSLDDLLLSTIETLDIQVYTDCKCFVDNGRALKKYQTTKLIAKRAAEIEKSRTLLVLLLC